MRNWITLGLCLVLLVSCRLDPGDTRVIAHAGSGAAYQHPKNSREALLKALHHGAHGIEMDVQMTRDSVLVIFHDQDLSEGTVCSGLVNSHSWEALGQCEALKDKAPISRLEDVLLEAAEAYPGAEFMLDIKLFAHGEWWPYLETFSNELVKLGSRPELRSKVFIECMVDEFLLLVQRKHAGLPLFLYSYEAEAAMWRAVTSHYRGITVNSRHISSAQVDKAQGMGVEVMILAGTGWLGNWNALRKKPDRLQTDTPEGLLP